MNKKLENYIRRKAHKIVEICHGLDAKDLMQDAWVIFLARGKRDSSFFPIRKHFNKVRMRMNRESKRFVSLDTLENESAFSHNPEDVMNARIDLHEDLKQIANPDSIWKERVAKERIKSYLKN